MPFQVHTPEQGHSTAEGGTMKVFRNHSFCTVVHMVCNFSSSEQNCI